MKRYIGNNLALLAEPLVVVMKTGAPEIELDCGEDDK